LEVWRKRLGGLVLARLGGLALARLGGFLEEVKTFRKSSAAVAEIK
jgi:hypothetical protein